MNYKPALLVAFSAVAILLSLTVFAWSFYLTWTIGPEIAATKRSAERIERDQKDASRRYDEAKEALTKATDSNRDSLTRGLELRREKMEELDRKATDTSEALATLTENFSGSLHDAVTILAGFFAAVVARMFGQELQKPNSLASNASRLACSFRALKSLFWFKDTKTWRKRLNVFCALAYVAVGFLAVVTSIIVPSSPDMMKNLATAFLTMLTAIVLSFLAPTSVE